jgi:hypothetical protein
MYYDRIILSPFQARLVSRSAVPKVCSMDPLGSVTSFQGICGYISVMVTLKFTYFFQSKEQYLVKNNSRISLIDNMFIWYDHVYFARTLQYLIKNT